MWVTKIRIAYSQDGYEWENVINPNPIQGDSSETLFLANIDSDTIRKITLPSVR
jgi:hypothetical protein